MARIAILWTHWSGYMEACYQALRRQAGEEPFVCFEASDSSAPFDPDGFSQKLRFLVYKAPPNERTLIDTLESFGPDLILICSWHITAYRAVARKFHGRAIRVLGMDNQWLGSLRQVLGLLAFRTVWRDLYEVAFVPGVRQAIFARLLGFNAAMIRFGLYAADVREIQAVEVKRDRKDWLFIGRDAPEKGLDTLFEAYRSYRTSVENPWNLILAGRIDRKDLGEGVILRGFIQPADLPELLSNVSALIVPSNFEPHGVVVQEAAAAGAALICSDAVGAADAFLRRGMNGLIYPNKSQEALCDAMIAVHGWSESQFVTAHEIGKALSLQFTPEMWASELIELAKTNFTSIDGLPNA